MESTQAAKEIKAPRYSRAVSWLGGASFGRASKRKSAPTPHGSYGTLPLLILDAAMVATFVFRGYLGADVSILAATTIAILCGIWLKRYNDTTVPSFRWAAVAIIGIQLLMFMPAFLLMLLQDSITVSTL